MSKETTKKRHDRRFEDAGSVVLLHLIVVAKRRSVGQGLDANDLYESSNYPNFYFEVIEDSFAPLLGLSG